MAVASLCLLAHAPSAYALDRNGRNFFPNPFSQKNPKAKLFIAGGNIDQKYKDQAPKEGVVFAPPIIDVKNYYYL